MARQHERGTLVFAVPALVWYGIFMVGPLVAMFYISLLHWTFLIAPSHYAGLENYRALLASDAFKTSLRNTLLLVCTLLPVMIPLAFMIGFHLTLRPRGHRILRVLMFTPGLISLSATAMVFFSILGPVGLLNGLLQGVGIDTGSRAWLGDSGTALAAIWAINLWQGVGYTAVLIAARLESVPQEIYEAAELDGATAWTRMWRIAWPIIRDYIGTVTMLQFLWTIFGGAGLILLLTNGGPGYATTTLGVLVYQKAFSENQLGYSQAVGVVLFGVGLVGMLGIRRLIRSAE